MAKIIFLGTPYFAVPVLKRILKSKYDIFSVFTQPSKKSNRGQKILKSPIHNFAEHHKLNVKTPVNIKSEINFIKKSKIDMGIVIAYGQIIPQEIIESCKFGFINIHASLLPKYRGAAPIHRSIMNLDQTTGISFMKLNRYLDSGPVSNQYKIKILENDNFETLSKKLSQLSAEKIIENIDLIFSNKVNFVNQNHAEATYAKKIDKLEGKINWNESSKKILGKINGLFPYPGAWFKFENKRYKILKSKLSKKTGKPGNVLDENLTVACGCGSIKILKIQREGKNSQNNTEFLLGSKIKKGSFLNAE